MHKTSQQGTRDTGGSSSCSLPKISALRPLRGLRGKLGGLCVKPYRKAPREARKGKNAEKNQLATITQSFNRQTLPGSTTDQKYINQKTR